MSKMRKWKIKLKEKPARIPDLYESQKTKAIQKYLEDIKKPQSEAAKSMWFSHLLRDLFEDIKAFPIEDYVRNC